MEAEGLKALMAPRIITEQDRKKAKRLLRIWNREKETLGLTQISAARKLKVTQPSFNQYLNCIIPLNTDMVLKCARMLGVDPIEIDPSLKSVTSRELKRLEERVKHLENLLDEHNIRY